MARFLRSTPAELGFSMPPEWAAHRATWFSWPRPEGISFPRRYETIPPSMAAIIRQIVPRERVEICVPNENYEILVRKQLEQAGTATDNVYFHFIQTNEAWCRDHGPIFVTRTKRTGRRESAIVDWGFNAWGEKYPHYAEDDLAPTRIAEELKIPVFDPKMVLEGGSIEVNGAGTLLTTESCLLKKNRNPKLSRSRIERRLKRYLGQKQVIWLRKGIAGDDTDGHIDDLARFVNPTTIVAAVEENRRDDNYAILQENLALLHEARNVDGKPFEIVPLPMPGVVEYEGHRLPATYTNFYFVNGALLVPTYRHKRNDRKALSALQRLLPDRQIIGIDCTDIIWGLGAIHCLTQQQPAV